MPETAARYEPPRFNPQVPNIARMYDYYLGGKDNFAADREAAEQALRVAPELRQGAAEVRKYLARAVRFLVGAGVRQFIDIGCGLPTQGNVHEIAQSLAPDARVAYADNDPVVIAHAQALLATNPLTRVVRADVRAPEGLLADPEVRGLIDFTRPVAFLLVAVLHVITDDEVVLRAVRVLREAMAPGSYLVIGHAVADIRPAVTARLAQLYQDTTETTGPRRANLRTKAEVEPYFDGMEMVDPGLVYITEWRPDPDDPWPGPQPLWSLGGVGRKP
ncbi:MAG TPA: SAM-dependent methyltransferase [Rugosimonospora sp.]|nr:SAM-dependent methyltransferase [Rugosimonospora sp.]